MTSLKKYFTGLRDYGGKFTLVESTIECILTAVMDNDSNNVELEKLLYVSTRRIKNGKSKRKVFDGISERDQGNIQYNSVQRRRSNQNVQPTTFLFVYEMYRQRLQKV